MGHKTPGRLERERRQKDAAERQTERDKRTPVEQWILLRDHRPGNSARERIRLEKQIDAAA